MRTLPPTFGIDPLRIEVRIDSLVTDLLDRLGRFLVNDTTRSPPPACLGRIHGGFAWRRSKFGIGLERDRPLYSRAGGHWVG